MTMEQTQPGIMIPTGHIMVGTQNHSMTEG